MDQNDQNGATIREDIRGGGEIRNERERDGKGTKKKEEQGKKWESGRREGSLTSVSTATSRQSYGWSTCYHKQPTAPAAAVPHLLQRQSDGKPNPHWQLVIIAGRLAGGTAGTQIDKTVEY